MTATKDNVLILKDGTLNSHFAEAYRVLRANISFSSIDQPARTILVTSASPREGKTTTVLNLGIIMGQAGSRVLIVDADFRHPSLQRVFNLPNGSRRPPGLSNLIAGKAEMTEVVFPTPYANVFALPTGVMPPNPSELLASKRMKGLMEELAEQADYVLLDSPPCLLYSDAYVMSRISDGVLYVLRAGAQDKAAQRRVQRQLQQAKARMLGVIFNDVDVEETVSNYSYYYQNRNGH